MQEERSKGVRREGVKRVHHGVNEKIRHYKIFCVNGKYGIQVRVSYFLFYTFAK